MRDLLRQLREHLREDFEPRSYVAVASLIGLALAAAYALDLEARYLDPYYQDPRQIPLYVAFYGVPWALSVALHAGFHGRAAALRDPKLWGLGLGALALYAVYANFHYYTGWIEAHVDPRGRLFVFHCAANLARAGLGFLGVGLFWWIAGRGCPPAFGLRGGEFRARPFLLLLLAIAPLIAWASQQADFLATYPRHEPGAERALWGLSRAQVYAIFELCYGADFVFTELFFRGLLIFGFVRWLGPGVVLPMTTWYALIHVSKPPGEAIASVFGGWALGVLALRTRSIRGGVLLHLGVAYMMELAAILQKGAR